MPLAHVIGGGLGGLSAAIRLRARGWDVHLFEAGASLGGKCNRVQREGYTFDTGPSVLTMPFLLDELFAEAGHRREDFLPLAEVEPGCCYRFSDGTVFEAPGRADAFREAIAEVFPGEEQGFDRFFKYTKKLWEISGPAFLYHPLGPGLLGRMNWKKALGGLSALRPSTLHREVSRYFKDPRLVQLFDRFATYNGSDPYRTPATFNVISYVELAFGSWRCPGGMYGLVEALESLARQIGVQISLNTPVKGLDFSHAGGRVRGLELKCGERLDTDAVVVNGDAIQALTGELCANHPKADSWKRKFAKREASTSGYVLLLALDRQFEGLACHNVLFNQDYTQEFRELFRQPQPLQDPTVYVYAPSRLDPSLAPEGKEGWFVLVNAPSLDRQPESEWPEDYPERIEKLLEARLPDTGFSAGSVQWREVLTPRFFRDRFGAWRGSLYGLSSNSPLSAFLRVSNQGPAENLFFAGGSAHPGGGIPLVLLSGKLAADAACAQ